MQYKQAESVYLILRRKDLCTCIYCYQTCVHESIVIYSLYGIICFVAYRYTTYEDLKKKKYSAFMHLATSWYRIVNHK